MWIEVLKAHKGLYNWSDEQLDVDIKFDINAMWAKICAVRIAFGES